MIYGFGFKVLVHSDRNYSKFQFIRTCAMMNLAWIILKIYCIMGKSTSYKLLTEQTRLTWRIGTRCVFEKRSSHCSRPFFVINLLCSSLIWSPGINICSSIITNVRSFVSLSCIFPWFLNSRSDYKKLLCNRGDRNQNFMPTWSVNLYIQKNCKKCWFFWSVKKKANFTNVVAII